MPSSRVLAFGSFDPLHAGHLDFFRQAAALGDHLTIVVARDSAIRELKERDPQRPQAERVADVARVSEVNEVIVGEEDPSVYRLLGELTFDVIALGYDQKPSDEDVRALLDARGKQHVKIVRLAPYKPEQYKSTYLRNT